MTYFLIILITPIIALAVGYFYGHDNTEPVFDLQNEKDI
jgi:hypothetical protein